MAAEWNNRSMAIAAITDFAVRGSRKSNPFQYNLPGRGRGGINNNILMNYCSIFGWTETICFTETVNRVLRFRVRF